MKKIHILALIMCLCFASIGYSQVGELTVNGKFRIKESSPWVTKMDADSIKVNDAAAVKRSSLPTSNAVANFVSKRYDSVKTITYAASVALRMDDYRHQTITLTGDLSLSVTSASIIPGRDIYIRIVPGASLRNLTFESAWAFVGTKPTTIASGKTGLLILRSFGTSTSDIVATWLVVP